jgi:hypothetical protein
MTEPLVYTWREFAAILLAISIISAVAAQRYGWFRRTRD